MLNFYIREYVPIGLKRTERGQNAITFFRNFVQICDLMLSLGLDIGSTTIKIIATNSNEQVVFAKYERHNALIREKVLAFLDEIEEKLHPEDVKLTITGSIGLGIAERYGIPFIQEVVASTHFVASRYSETKTLIDIGGEDAKVVFFHDREATDLRMNGNCAGGTGAFIDQMAILLGIDNDELSRLAMKSERIYPIASRCGVFCKTDIQNLIAKNVDTTDICASIFHAVAVQTVMTLSHGCDITPPILFSGGPLSFLPALRRAFRNYLNLEDQDMVVPDNSHLIPAWGTALYGLKSTDHRQTLGNIINLFKKENRVTYTGSKDFKPLFDSAVELSTWKEEKLKNKLQRASLEKGNQEVFLGIDSGSTTTKIVALNDKKQVLFTYYHSNNGNPILTVLNGLRELDETCQKAQTKLVIKSSCSTGYGEDLIKTAFHLENGVIETIAHYMAAHHIVKDVSFILDIGGQDMKAIFVNDGVINHIEINEACSSGCGTFIETFAKSLGYTVGNFAEEACHATHPCDLGTRCTVFMNSKVKQVLREGANVGDIASGLSYSVINNCLYKVLKIKNNHELGNNIVVQGGTMHNDAVCRALEKLTGKTVYRSDCPELMGAYGAALYAMSHTREDATLEDVIDNAQYTTKTLQCRGCENQCLVNKYIFQHGQVFYSGNKCEKIFNNKGKQYQAGRNLYEEKYALLFDRSCEANINATLRIGIPRILNMYEEFPFWHALFSHCGIQVILSEGSNYRQYEKGVKYVMSDNICFPAKLCHSHILDLIGKKVDRIFFPYVIYEKKDIGKNSYNCPIVSGYSDVLRNSMNIPIPLDAPAITFKDEKALEKECTEYLKGLGIKKNVIAAAFKKALEAQKTFEHQLWTINKETFEKNKKDKKLIILLAGRPYHTDPLVQHKISDMICNMGVDVMTEDIVRNENIDIRNLHFISQWSYPEHILKAAKWAAEQDENIQFIEITSFGCGPDALMLDEIHNLLKRHNKALTQLKVDDVCNIGSLKLRVRSVIDSMRLHLNQKGNKETLPFKTTPIFDETERLKRKKILVPYFTPFISPLIPTFMKLSGYDFDVLPMSDKASSDYGLKYANNEICYPATLIVGDLIKAFKSEKYIPETTAVAITQTGGQCRATNYISLIKKAMVDAGYSNVPVISLSFSDENIQPGFQFKWKKILNIAVATILYTDALAKMYYAALPREKEKGEAERIKNLYLDKAKKYIENNHTQGLSHCLKEAATEFKKICINKVTHKVGIVGEIFLKFHFYAQRHITEWLVEKNIEVEPPLLTPFFLQAFVNIDVNHHTQVERSTMAKWIRDSIYRLIRHRIHKYDKICSVFSYYTPFDDIYDIAEKGKDIVSLNAQFGEGWLLPGEVATMARHGIKHVVSLQPFGCIANHIISKGIEKRLKACFPDVKFLSLDFDSGVSDVNVVNRMLLFVNDLLTSSPKP